MTKSLKTFFICSAMALGVSQTANANISASLKSVCDQSVGNQTQTQESATSNNAAYSSMLTSHFSATSCAGQQLLKQARADKAEKSTLDDVQAELVRSTD